MSHGNRSLAPVLLSAALLAATGAACRQRSYAQVADAAAPPSDAPAPLILDIAVTGCDAYDPINDICSGSAPLVLYFSPVGSPQFTRFTWSFDDGSPLDTDRAPMHQFLLPGTYEVDLVGAFGVANTVKTTITIKVAALAAGEPCDFDLQCGKNLRCACAPGTGCDPAFQHGICSTSCDGQGTACGGTAVCAALALALAPPPDGGSPALGAWCVAACQTAADCAVGFACEILAGMTSGSPSPWTRGCLPIGALGDVGATCRSANGQLADAACATGSCLDIGALGSCSASCGDPRGCPPGTTCAALVDGRELCLVDCDPGVSCTRDPLLACAAPTIGDPGTGFRIDGGPGASYCAPKPCAYDADCAPAGQCGSGAQCVRSAP